MRNKPAKRPGSLDIHHDAILGDVFNGFEVDRNSVARSVNRIMTAAYWLIDRYGRGFSVRNVWQMKGFYLTWAIPQTPSAESCHPQVCWHGPAGALTPSPAGAVPAKAEMNEEYFRR